VSNVLNDEKTQQVIALGRSGWLLRGIERVTSVRREAASGYLKAVEIALRPPGFGAKSVSGLHAFSFDLPGNSTRVPAPWVNRGASFRPLSDKAQLAVRSRHGRAYTIMWRIYVFFKPTTHCGGFRL
jgi:hypothetical protein